MSLSLRSLTFAIATVYGKTETDKADFGATAANLRFVRTTETRRLKLLHPASMSGLVKLRRSDRLNHEGPLCAVSNRLDFLDSQNAAGRHSVKRAPKPAAAALRR
jgi:hypothetical protein